MSVFLKRLSDKGKDITGLMGKQFEIFSARLRAMSHVTPDEAASICDELETGPWTDEQQDDLTSLVGEKLSHATIPAAAYRCGGGGRKQQKCEFFDNYLTEDTWKAIEANTNLSEVFRILGEQACEVGLVLPSEPTFKVMTAIAVCCSMQQPSMPDHLLHDIMEALKHIVKPMLAQATHRGIDGYRVEYPVNPLELPPDVFKSIYGDGAPMASPKAAEIHVVAAKKFARGSGRGLRAHALVGGGTAVARPGSSRDNVAEQVIQGLAALLGGSLGNLGHKRLGDDGGAPGFRLLGKHQDADVDGLELRTGDLKCFRPRGEQLGQLALQKRPRLEALPASFARKQEEDEAAEEEDEPPKAAGDAEEQAESPIAKLANEMALAAKAAKDSKGRQKAALAAATAKAIYVHATLCTPTPTHPRMCIEVQACLQMCLCSI